MSQKYLSDVRAVIMEQGLGKARTQILSKQLESKGGATEQLLTGTVTHVFVGNNVKLSRVLKSLKVECLPAGVQVLRADWLSNCLVKGQKLDHAPYVVLAEDPIPATTSSPPHATTSSPHLATASFPPPATTSSPPPTTTSTHQGPVHDLPSVSSLLPTRHGEEGRHMTGHEAGVILPCQVMSSLEVQCSQDTGATSSSSGLKNKSPQKV